MAPRWYCSVLVCVRPRFRKAFLWRAFCCDRNTPCVADGGDRRWGVLRGRRQKNKKDPAKKKVFFFRGEKPKFYAPPPTFRGRFTNPTGFTANSIAQPLLFCSFGTVERFLWAASVVVLFVSLGLFRQSPAPPPTSHSTFQGVFFQVWSGLFTCTFKERIQRERQNQTSFNAFFDPTPPNAATLFHSYAKSSPGSTALQVFSNVFNKCRPRQAPAYPHQKTNIISSLKGGLVPE